jgi:hypothetical protein
MMDGKSGTMLSQRTGKDDEPVNWVTELHLLRVLGEQGHTEDLAR